MDDSSQGGDRGTGQLVRRACTFCQNRHLKCDGAQPCGQCERRHKDCVFLPLTHTKRTSAAARRAEVEEERAQHQWRQSTDDSGADGGVFALDGDDDGMDVQGSFKKRKRKATAATANHLMDDEMDGNGERPGRYALPAAAAILSANANGGSTSSMMSGLVLGNGSGSSSSHGMKSNLSDSALDASAALSQLSGVSVSGTASASGGLGGGAGIGSGSSKTVSATNAWMVAFAQGVSPFTSSAPFTPLDALELQRILALDSDQMNSLSPELLSRALMQCAMLAHGSRYTGNLETSSQHGWKAWQLVKVCMGRKRVHTIPALAQTLVSSLELLAYYYIGTSDFFKCRTIVSQAYHIYVNHKQYLADSTAHRVLGLMIGASCSLDDTEFWLAKAKALNLQASTPFETSGWVVLALMLSSNMIGIADRDILPLRPKQMQEREFTHKIAVLHVIDESEKAVVFFELTPMCIADPHSQKVCKVHKAVLDGCRALILWQCGFEKEAVTYVNRVLAAGKPDNTSRLPHLLALAYSTQVARCLNQRLAFNKGIEFLEDGIYSYAYIRLLWEELKKPVSLAEQQGVSASNLSSGTLVGTGAGFGSDESAMSTDEPSATTPGGGMSGITGGGGALGGLSGAGGGGLGGSLFKSTTTSSALGTPSLFSSAASRGSGFTSKLGGGGLSGGAAGSSRANAPLLASLGSLSGKNSLTDPSSIINTGGSSSISPRAGEDDGSGMSGITPMRPNPMKVSLFSRGTGHGQSVSPQMQSVSPLQGVSPHHLQGVSPHHLLQGVSPLAQGLSPFTSISTPLIQPHLVPHLNQFSPQIGGFLGVGSTFSPGGLQSTSPSWAGAALPSEYLMDASEPPQWS